MPCTPLEDWLSLLDGSLPPPEADVDRHGGEAVHPTIGVAALQPPPPSRSSSGPESLIPQPDRVQARLGVCCL